MYKGLYTLERAHVLAEFEKSSPHLSEFEAEMENYEQLESEISQLPSQQSLTAAIQLSNGKRRKYEIQMSDSSSFPKNLSS